MKYTCPVCGYKDLLEPPKNDMICPSCGTQFGYHDSGVTHEKLRAAWLNEGALWHSRRIHPPKDWNAYKQLEGLGIFHFSEAASITRTEVKILDIVTGTFIGPLSNVSISRSLSLWGTLLEAPQHVHLARS
ncbi:MAG: hypothetical protein HY231_05060 [Acidobacteria bacterium]|nr:hypothetical protein [Acidobacteriota bacterium]